MEKSKIILLLLINFFFAGCSVEDTAFLMPTPKPGEAKSVESTNFIATWHPIEGAQSYMIDVAFDKTFEQIMPEYKAIEVKDTFLLIENLKPFMEYFYRVSSKIDGNLSEHSSTVSIRTKNLIPPEATPASDIGSLSFKATWKASPGADEYLFTVSSDPEFEETHPEFTEVATTDLHINITDLEPNKKYYYKVRAISENSISDFSNMVDITTLELGVVSALEATEISKTSFTANWKNLPGTEEYLLTVSRNADFTDLLSEYDDKVIDALFFTIVNLDANTTYYYKVKSQNGDYVSPYSNVSSITTLKLAEPLVAEPTNIQLTSFVANWTSDEEFANVFYVDIATDQNFENILPEYNNHPIVGNKIEALRLTPGTLYYYRVRSGGLNSISENSETGQCNTKGLLAPENITYSSRKAFTFETEWEASDLATSYVITIAYDEDFSEIVEGYREIEILDTNIKVKTKEFDRDFYVRVQSKHLDYKSDYSETKHIKPAFGPSCQVTELQYRDRNLKFTYDALSRCEKVEWWYTSGYINDTYTFSYTGNNLLPHQMKNNTYTTAIEYEDGRISSSVLRRNTDGSLYQIIGWEYDEKDRLVKLVYYSSLDRTTALGYYQFVYDENDNPIQSSLHVGDEVSQKMSYRYDDKLSPNALLPYPTFMAIRHSYATSTLLFPFIHNMTYMKSESAEEVFSFDYNEKDLGIESHGYYSTKVILNGCDE